MRVRLEVQAHVNGSQWEFWKAVETSAVPGVGDLVALGARTGAASELNERAVVAVRWAADLDQVQVRLADLDPSWLSANRREFADAGWLNAMAGT